MSKDVQRKSRGRERIGYSYRATAESLINKDGSVSDDHKITLISKVIKQETEREALDTETGSDAWLAAREKVLEIMDSGNTSAILNMAVASVISGKGKLVPFQGKVISASIVPEIEAFAPERVLPILVSNHLASSAEEITQPKYPSKISRGLPQPDGSIIHQLTPLGEGIQHFLSDKCGVDFESAQEQLRAKLKATVHQMLRVLHN